MEEVIKKILVMSLLIILCLSSIMQSVYASSSRLLLIKLSAPTQQEQDLQLKLSRKVRLKQFQPNVVLDNSSNKNYVSQEEESLAGELEFEREADKEHGIARKLVRQQSEEEEEADATQFLHMDYWHVRKRQPIHNKFVPLHQTIP